MRQPHCLPCAAERGAETAGRYQGLPACICLAVSMELAAWPSFTDSLANIRQTSELAGYEELYGEKDDGMREREIEAAFAYNRQIAEEQKRKTFEYRGDQATDAEYEALLSDGDGGTMGYLSVPSIGIDLPIGHGTRSGDLEYRCGHMYGTSLPVGGTDTHAVIAAHTGLPAARLFSDLTELREHDEFFIRIAGETHAYRVETIRVILPEEEPAYLGIEAGRDLVTLYTCTPYGINDHRLLVTGGRVLPDPVRKEGGEGPVRIVMKSRMAAVRAAVLAFSGPDILLLGLIRAGKRRKRGRAAGFQ